MNVLLLDHNDSFTFNIVEVFRHFENCSITVINYNDIDLNQVHVFDKIILSPGPCLPENYPKTTQLIKQFYKTKSILGICLGHQAICSYFGSDLYTMDKVIHGIKKEITNTQKSQLFKDIPKKTDVGLYHSWAVKSTNLSSELKITATTKDNMIMAIEHEKYHVYGIQFHPESFLTTHGTQLLKNFIEL